MSRFVNPITSLVSTIANFATISEETINIFPCADGSLAGFRIINLGTSNEPYYVSQIFNSTDGDNILIGTTCVQPGWDMAGGLFVTACLPDRNPLDSDCIFYLLDYPAPRVQDIL